jgi:hypothetical protein
MHAPIFSVILFFRCFSIFDRVRSISSFGLVIAQFVVWAKPNSSHKCVTQLVIPITVTSIDTPLVLVKDKANTRKASRVALGGLQGRSKELEEHPYRSQFEMI